MHPRMLEWAGWELDAWSLLPGESALHKGPDLERKKKVPAKASFAVPMASRTLPGQIKSLAA